MSKPIRQTVPSLLSYLAESAWVAYPAIVLLQAKVMLWIWDYRDLTPGDTSYYYTYVFTWLDEAKVDIVWSPIYTIFLGALHRLLGDPFWVVTVAQVGIAICASVLALALLRRLLPKYVAWMIAAWWAVLPITFDTVYSVHLFSALFLLAIFVIAAHKKNIYGRGIVLGGLLGSAVLVRNEYGALFLLWIIALAAYEFYSRSRKSRSHHIKTYLAAYGLPILLALIISCAFYANSKPQYPEIKQEIETKHTLNMCQIYAYNRRQQGDPWKGDPWTECQSLIERDFGRSSVTFSQAFFLNPRPMLEHIWWNIKLIPSGTQLALFNYYAGGANPDYIKARQSPLVWAPFLLVLGLSLFGAIRHFVKPGMGKDRAKDNWFAWLLMLSAAFLALGIMMMQRPRPSYMFPYSLFIMALAGLGLHEILELMNLSRAVKTVWPVAGIFLILLVPSYFDEHYTNHFGYKGQALRDLYEETSKNFNRALIRLPSIILTPAGDYTDLCNYLGVDCRSLASEGSGSFDRRTVQVYPMPGDFQEENLYILYLDDMIWKFSLAPRGKESGADGYVELNCFSLVNNVMKCRDGEIDLGRGVMNDGTADIPLRSALFINDGFVVDRKNYRTDQGYYLQIMMKDNKINRILVADDRLFRTNFNQQYLLGNFDRRSFEEVFNDFPAARIFKVKGVDR